MNAKGIKNVNIFLNPPDNISSGYRVNSPQLNTAYVSGTLSTIQKDSVAVKD